MLPSTIDFSTRLHSQVYNVLLNTDSRRVQQHDRHTHSGSLTKHPSISDPDAIHYLYPAIARLKTSWAQQLEMVSRATYRVCYLDQLIGLNFVSGARMWAIFTASKGLSHMSIEVVDSGKFGGVVA